MPVAETAFTDICALTPLGIVDLAASGVRVPTAVARFTLPIVILDFA